jgi:uncharacterized protein (TIGR02246 family)
MQMKSFLYAMALLGFSIVTSTPAYSQNPNKKESKEIAAIKQLSLDLDAAWNRHDVIAFSELFLEDADFQYWNGFVLKNQQEVEQYYRTQVFKDPPTALRHTSTIQRIRFIRPDVAIGDGTVVISREGAPESEKPALSCLLTAVGQKKNGKWKIAAVRLMFPAEKIMRPFSFKCEK